MKKAQQGIHFDRVRTQDLERQFAETWDRKHREQDLVRHILNPPERNPLQPLAVSDRDRQVAATMMQWLGSEEGQAFLVLAMGGKRPRSGRKAIFGRRT